MEQMIYEFIRMSSYILSFSISLSLEKKKNSRKTRMSKIESEIE